MPWELDTVMSQYDRYGNGAVCYRDFLESLAEGRKSREPSWWGKHGGGSSSSSSSKGQRAQLRNIDELYRLVKGYMRPVEDFDLTGDEPPAESTAALWLRFKLFDEDGKDYIDVGDLKAVMKKLNMDPSAEQLRALMRRLLGPVEGSVVRFGRFCEIAREEDEDDVGASYKRWATEQSTPQEGLLGMDELERKVKSLVKKRAGKSGKSGGRGLHPRRAFAFFDRNNNGCVTLAELRRTLFEEGLQFSNSSLKALATKMGLKHHPNIGTCIRFKEFLQWASPVTPKLLQTGKKLMNLLFKSSKKGGGSIDLRRVFNKMDKEGLGSTSNRDFKRFVREQDGPFSANELEQLVTQIDSNSDGRITYTEFADFVDLLTGHISKVDFGGVTM